MTTYAEDKSGHLANALLVRTIDEEISGSEMVGVERHLAGCEECRHRLADLRRVSDGFANFLSSLQPSYAASERTALVSKMRAAEGVAPAVPVRPAVPVSKLLGRFAWALAAAAALAVGFINIPFQGTTTGVQSKAGVAQMGSAFEVDGETFVSLPYSNPDLPMGSAHVVQMQVPLSSLADAGVFVEPLANRMAMPDRPVLADVLLGLDGQPVGVHVLTTD